MSRPRLRIGLAATGGRGLDIAAARNALYAWLLARSQGGTVILRTDSIAVDHAVGERRAIDDLLWLGLGWDEGIDEAGERGPYRRIERTDLYRSAAEELLRGGRAYRCVCSPGEGGVGAPCRCRAAGPAGIDSKRDASIRLKVAAGTDAAEVTYVDLVHGPVRKPTKRIGDPILLMSDSCPSASFATALDDALMGITDVISDDESETLEQALVHGATRIGEQPRFTHLPPIAPVGGEPGIGECALLAIEPYRTAGYPPEAILNFLAQLGGASQGSQNMLTREEMLAQFDPSRPHCEPPRFDAQRLAALSRRHLARLSPERLAELAARHLAAAGLLRQPPSDRERTWAGALAGLFVDSLTQMSDLPGEAEMLFRFDPKSSFADPIVRQLLDQPAARRAIGALVSLLEEQDERSGEAGLNAVRFQEVVAAVRRSTGMKGRELYDALRIALTGRPDGPDLIRLITLIEAGSALSLPQPVVGCRDRARQLLQASAAPQT